MTFAIGDDIIDSWEIIERIEELESEHNSMLDDDPSGRKLALWLQGVKGTEYRMLREFAEECEQCSANWKYGEILISDEYFEEYMDEMIEDCYQLPRDLPYWITITYDYEALKQDYTEVSLDGFTYYIRSV